MICSNVLNMGWRVSCFVEFITCSKWMFSICPLSLLDVNHLHVMLTSSWIFRLSDTHCSKQFWWSLQTFMGRFFATSHGMYALRCIFVLVKQKTLDQPPNPTRPHNRYNRTQTDTCLKQFSLQRQTWSLWWTKHLGSTVLTMNSCLCLWNKFWCQSD